MVRASIKIINFYRRIATERVRKSCRFEPSCSEYAIRSITKYGALQGWCMSLARLKRCKPPNGGLDEP